jgi:glycerophosphoryl diester phosphodiesterase
MTLNIPKIISHRGAAGYAPENTLVSLHTAADMGVEWVEFDVKLTKDDVPILFHDDLLDRTTNGSGTIGDKTYAEICELDAGHWMGESFIDTRIPTLEQAIDVLLERDLGVNIEIKACPGRERETAEVALDMLSQVWDDHNNILISSFSHVSLEIAQDMTNDWARGFLLPDHEQEAWAENWEDIAKHLDVATINVNGNTCTRDQIDGIMELEKPILAYTINDPQRARLLQSWGVDGFFTDTPDVIRENLLMVH